MAGCGTCCGDDAETVWSHSSALARVAAIVEESHFSVRVVRCASCGQSFASVFCETIDWTGGNDPQDWLLVPLTEGDVATLIAAGEDGVERALAALVPERYLVRSYPRTGPTPAVGWVHGPVWVPRHD